jgi:hypothetical protein
VWDAEATRHIIGGLVIAGHRCCGRPGEVVMQHLSQRIVFRESDVGQSMVEADNRSAIHFIVLPVPAVHLDDGGLVTIGIGIRGRATECLGPVSGESLDMLGVEAVAECMGDDVVAHHPTMPGVGKTAQAVVPTSRLEDSLHASMMTTIPSLCKTMARRAQLGRAIPMGLTKDSPGLSPTG